MIDIKYQIETVTKTNSLFDLPSTLIIILQFSDTDLCQQKLDYPWVVLSLFLEGWVVTHSEVVEPNCAEAVLGGVLIYV